MITLPVVFSALVRTSCAMLQSAWRFPIGLRFTHQDDVADDPDLHGYYACSPLEFSSKVRDFERSLCRSIAQEWNDKLAFWKSLPHKLLGIFMPGDKVVWPLLLGRHPNRIAHGGRGRRARVSSTSVAP